MAAQYRLQGGAFDLPVDVKGNGFTSTQVEGEDQPFVHGEILTAAVVDEDGDVMFAQTSTFLTASRDNIAERREAAMSAAAAGLREHLAVHGLVLVENTEEEGSDEE